MSPSCAENNCDIINDMYSLWTSNMMSKVSFFSCRSIYKGFYCWHYTMCKSDQSCRNVFYLTTIHQQRIIRLNSVKLVTVYAGESEQSVSLQIALPALLTLNLALDIFLVYICESFMLNKRKNNDGMKKYQFLLVLLTKISEKILWI